MNQIYLNYYKMKTQVVFLDNAKIHQADDVAITCEILNIEINFLQYSLI